MQTSESGRDRPGRGAAILLMSTADWDAPLWTNKQYMARELAVDNDVVFMESLGLRRPRLDVSDARRIGARVARRLGRTPESTGRRPVPSRVEVVRPLVAPFHNRATKRLNASLVTRAAAPWTSMSGPHLLWTYSPITYDLERHAVHGVYHAVDLLGAYPGIRADVVSAGERRLAAAGVTAIASSEPVREHLRGQGFECILHWPNVADVDRFTAAGRASDRARRVVFGGNLSPHKVDLDLVASLARSHPELEIVLAGPTDEGGGGRWTAPDDLARLGVRLAGPLTPEALAGLYATASVGIIPYRDTEYTRGVDPLKLYEYLAAGLTVVGTDLPGIRASTAHLPAADVALATDARSFVRAVAERVAPPSDDDVRRRVGIARRHSWTKRGDEARRLVTDLVASPGLGS